MGKGACRMKTVQVVFVNLCFIGKRKMHNCIFSFFIGNNGEGIRILPYTVGKGGFIMYTRYVLKQGDVGIAVNKQQGYLNMLQARGLLTTRLLEDGEYGPKTTQAVREYQRYLGMAQDGVIGNNTWDGIVNKLRELGLTTNIPVASKSFYLSQGNSGIDVFKMQEYLNELAASNNCLRPIPVDGTYGARTTTAVQMFQYLNDLNIDGVIGKATWDSIVNERNKIPV